MNEIGLITIAVEDDSILLSYGLISFEQGNIVSERYLKPEEIVRPQYEGKNKHRDVSDFHLESILEFAIKFIGKCLKKNWRVDAVGISVFGNVSANNSTVSHIPNRGFGNSKDAITVNFRKRIKGEYPNLNEENIIVLNDATAAAVGEAQFDSSKSKSDALAYIWLGRGVNGGLVLNTQHWQGYLHPEMAHYFPRIYDKDLDYVSSINNDPNPKCVLHGDCLMGLASLRSLKQRLNTKSKSEVTDIYAYYIAQLCATITCMVAPSKIILGGYIFRTELIEADKLLDLVINKYSEIFVDYPKYNKMSDTELFIRVSNLGKYNSTRGLIAVIKKKFGINSISTQE